jgi:hypothetical protein
LPKEWTADQIRSFQDYFDALMSGNLARRRQTKFMPADFKLIEARQPPLKDQYDEWLARIICYAFSVPVSPFVAQVNRATSETLRQQATQEGLVPLKRWLKNALDHVIHVCMNEPGLEFVWVGDDAVDPLEQAQTLNILVSAGIKTREEARADLGLAPPAGGAPAKAPAKALRKFNPHHDERGLFAAEDNAAGPVGSTARKPRPTRVQAVSNDAVMSDVGGLDVAQISEPPPPIDPPGPPRPPGGEESTLKDTGSSPTPQSAAEPSAENPAGSFDSADEDTEPGSPRFTDEDLLAEHFTKHMYDFDAETASEYEDLAAQFLTNKNNPDVLEITRPDGDVVRFNPNTDEFGILTGDGNIRTYLRLDVRSHDYPSNLDYFYAQKGRNR